jgi:hypothetical protein
VFLKRLAIAILASTIPFIAFAQRAGTGIIEGGGSGNLPLSAPGETITYSLSLWAWSGRFMTDTFEIGPYVSLGFTGTQDSSQGQSSSTFDLNPGLQAGIAYTDEGMMLMVRVTTAMQLQVDSLTSLGSTSRVFWIPGIWAEIDPELAVDLGQNACITFGPAFSVYYFLRGGGLSVAAGYNIGFRVRF